MNYEIKKVEIGFLTSIENTGKIQQGNVVYNIEKEVTREIICIIDTENNIAVDLNNFNNKYQILKRNSYNQILPNQEIVSDREYALKLNNLGLEDLDILKKIKYNYKKRKYEKEQGKTK